LRLRDDIGEVVDRLLVYAKLRRDEDTTHSENLARFDRAGGLEARFQAATAFFTPEILAIDERWVDSKRSPAIHEPRSCWHPPLTVAGEWWVRPGYIESSRSKNDR